MLDHRMETFLTVCETMNLDVYKRQRLEQSPSFFFASELDTRTSICLRKSETRDRAGRLSESPNFSFSLMLKNLCRKLTQRAATIGAFGVSSAGKAGLLVWNSRE